MNDEQENEDCIDKPDIMRPPDDRNEVGELAVKGCIGVAVLSLLTTLAVILHNQNNN